MSVNKVILLGNTGRQPEIRDGAGGAKFATFSLATTDRAYTKKDGTQIPERTEWHNIVANGRLVETIEKYVTTGTKLYIEGKLRTRKYTDRNNVERYTTEIYLDTMELLGSKPEQQPQQNVNVPFYNQQRSQQQNPGIWNADDDLPY